MRIGGKHIAAVIGAAARTPVKLRRRRMKGARGFDHGRCIGSFTSIRQNILVACYYDKQREEQTALQHVVPTACLENEIKDLAEFGLPIERIVPYIKGMIHLPMCEEIRFAAYLIQSGVPLCLHYIKKCAIIKKNFQDPLTLNLTSGL